MLRAPVTSYIYPILFEVQRCFESMKDWLYAFLNSVFQPNGDLVELKPLFVIGIAVSVIFVAILLIKRVVWSK